MIIMLAATIADLPDKVWAIGSGHNSCATAMIPANFQRTVSWVAGYFTGLNAGWGGNVGHTTDLTGIFGEVKLECAKSPSQSLIFVTSTVYNRLKAEHR
jgi:hypothetical protein